MECPRDRFCHPVDLQGEDAEARLTRRYAHANDKVVARAPADVIDGMFEAELELPADLKPGKYFVKAWTPKGVGAFVVEVAEERERPQR